MKNQKRKRVILEKCAHDYPVYANLVKEIIPERTNQGWVSDITYISLSAGSEKVDGGFCYLSLITDIYSKEIIGYSPGRTLETKYTMEALEMAFKRLQGDACKDLIHHSDRGVQYASYAYTDALKEKGVKISMTESGNPKDNAVAERVNNTIKNELLMGMNFQNMEEVRKALDAAVEFYNTERPHMSPDGMTPSEASHRTGEIPKEWTSFRENAIRRNRDKGNYLYLR